MSDIKLPNMQHPVVPTDGPRTYQSAALQAGQQLNCARKEADEGNYDSIQALPMDAFRMADADNRGNGGGTFGPDDIMRSYSSKGPSGGRG